MPKRKALVVGVDKYPGTGADLRGCVADAEAWAQLLRERGFDVTMLLDEDATADAFRDHLRRLLDAAEYRDEVLVCQSSHGTWVPDRSGDEPDRRDEALCYTDIGTGHGLVTDDELFELFTGRAYGVKATLIVDACHSGTLSRLGAPIGDESRRVRFLPPSAFLSEEQTAAARTLEGAPRGRSRQTALLLAACAESEVAYELDIDGRPGGAFTAAALHTLRRGEPTDFRSWHKLIRQVLPSQDVYQSPQLLGSSAQRRWPVFR